MKSRKIFLLLVLFIFVMFNLQCVHAQSNYKINMEYKDVEESNEIIVDISLKEAQEKILGMQGKIEYDSNLLELDKINVNSDAWNVTAFNKENGEFMIEISDDSFNDESKFMGSGNKILDAVFKIKKRSNTQIKISEVMAVNSKFETIEIDNDEVNINSINFIYIFIVGLIICVIIFSIIFIRKRK